MTIGKAVRKILATKRKQFPQGDYGHYVWEGQRYYNKKLLAIAIRNSLERANQV